MDVGNQVQFCLDAASVIAVLVALFYNVKTYLLVRHIQQVAGGEGREWPFWTRIDRRLDLLYRPLQLFDPSDSNALRLAKEQLIDHRNSMGTALRFVGTVVLLAIGAMIVILVHGAQVESKQHQTYSVVNHSGP